MRGVLQAATICLTAGAALAVLGVSSGRAQAPVDLPEQWAQTNLQWTGATLLDNTDNPPHTLGWYGCTLTTAAMLLRFHGATTMPDGQPLNPGSLNRWLLQTGLFASPANVSWPLLVSFANLYLGRNLQYRPQASSPTLCCDPVSEPRCDEARASFYTGLGYPLPIRRTTHDCADPLPPPATGCCNKHSVLLLGEYEDFGEWWMADPAYFIEFPQVVVPNYWDRLTVVVPASAPTFGQQELHLAPTGLVSEVSSATSSTPAMLMVSASGAAKLLVIDPLGRRCGRDSTGATFSEIPGTAVEDGASNSDDDGTRSDHPGTGGFVVASPLSGAYGVHVSGAAPGILHWAIIGTEGTLLRETTVDPGGPLVRRYSKTVPASLSARTGVAEDRVTLPGRIICPVTLGPESLLVMEADLAAGSYLRRPTLPAFDTFDPTKGVRCIAAGQVAGAGSGLTLAATSLVSLPPAGGNHAPVAGRDSLTTTSCTLRIAKTALLANDSDVDGQPLTIQAVGMTPVTQGSVSMVGDSIQIVLPPGFSGTTEFVYTVSDGLAGLAAAPVRVRMNGTTGVESETPGVGFAITRLAPNPAGGEVTVVFRLPANMSPRVEVLDVAGRRVAARQLANTPAGEHRVTISLRGVPAGTYFVRLVGANRAASQKLLILE